MYEMLLQSSAKSKKKKQNLVLEPPNIKKYLYSDQLKFLKKLYITRGVEENFEVDSEEIDDTDGDHHTEENLIDEATPIKKRLRMIWVRQENVVSQMS